mgnify:CR=1 FL=1
MLFFLFFFNLNRMSEEEKKEIRKCLFDSLGESNYSLVKQYAVAFSIVAKFDFPNHWFLFMFLFVDFLGLICLMIYVVYCRRKVLMKLLNSMF